MNYRDLMDTTPVKEFTTAEAAAVINGFLQEQFGRDFHATVDPYARENFWSVILADTCLTHEEQQKLLLIVGADDEDYNHNSLGDAPTVYWISQGVSEKILGTALGFPAESSIATSSGIYLLGTNLKAPCTTIAIDGKYLLTVLSDANREDIFISLHRATQKQGESCCGAERVEKVVKEMEQELPAIIYVQEINFNDRL